MNDDIDPDSSDKKRGIDILGDTVEADGELSANFPFYGDLHNEGHVLIAYSHDPDGSHNVSKCINYLFWMNLNMDIC